MNRSYPLETAKSLIFERPSPDEGIQNICMDRGYDFPEIRELVKEYGYTAHIKSRGEENIRIEIPGLKPIRKVNNECCKDTVGHNKFGWIAHLIV